MAVLALDLRLKLRLGERTHYEAGFDEVRCRRNQLGQVLHVLVGNDDGLGNLTAYRCFAHGLSHVGLGGLLSRRHGATCFD